MRALLLWPGAPLALASAALFGASTPFAKLLVGTIDPWLLAGLLYLASGFVLGLWMGARRILGRPTGEAPLRRHDLPWLAGVVFSGGVVGPVLLMIGLSGVTASAAALLLNLEGLATMAIAWLAFRENVDRRILAGALAILAGAVVLSWQADGDLAVDWGVVAIVGACLAWGIDNNLTRKLSSADPIQIATAKGLVAGAINVSLALANGASLPRAEIVAAAGVVGLLGYGVSIALFVLALRHLGTARTGAYYSTAPFIGALLSIAMLAEPASWQFVVAGSLMAAGVWLHLVERHEHRHRHEPMEHEHRHRHDAHHLHEHGSQDPPGEPHSHRHRHGRLVHSHAHYPDLHHRHRH